jgi:hypothetical protein
MLKSKAPFRFNQPGGVNTSRSGVVWKISSGWAIASGSSLILSWMASDLFILRQEQDAGNNESRQSAGGTVEAVRQAATINWLVNHQRATGPVWPARLPINPHRPGQGDGPVVAAAHLLRHRADALGPREGRQLHRPA